MPQGFRNIINYYYYPFCKVTVNAAKIEYTWMQGRLQTFYANVMQVVWAAIIKLLWSAIEILFQRSASLEAYMNTGEPTIALIPSAPVPVDA